MRRREKHEEKSTQFDTDLIKSIADVETVAESLGLETRRQGKNISILCPDHNDQHFGSCFLTKSGYNCYACGSHGDMIHLVMHVLHSSFEEACEYIASIYGRTEDFRFASSERPNKRLLDDESLRLIGLGREPEGDRVYAHKYVVLNPSDVEDILEPTQRLKWVPVRSRRYTGYYIVQDLLSSNPLRDLLFEDEAAYNELIARKAGEAADKYRAMIEMAKDPMRYYTNEQYDEFLIACHCEEVADTVGFVNWEKVLLQKIRKCDNIRIEHSCGAEAKEKEKEPTKPARRKSVFGKIKSNGVSF